MCVFCDVSFLIVIRIASPDVISEPCESQVKSKGLGIVIRSRILDANVLSQFASAAVSVHYFLFHNTNHVSSVAFHDSEGRGLTTGPMRGSHAKQLVAQLLFRTTGFKEYPITQVVAARSVAAVVVENVDPAQNRTANARASPAAFLRGNA